MNEIKKLTNFNYKIKWYKFWRWCFIILFYNINEKEYDKYFDMLTSKTINWRYHYRPWNIPLGRERVMVIITEEDIQKGLVREKSGGCRWNVLVLPHKYKYVENQTDEIKRLFMITGIHKAMGHSEIIFV